MVIHTQYIQWLIINVILGLRKLVATLSVHVAWTDNGRANQFHVNVSFTARNDYDGASESLIDWE